MADDFRDRLFEGSLTEVVTIVIHREVSKDELTDSERLIAQRKKEL